MCFRYGKIWVNVLWFGLFFFVVVFLVVLFFGLNDVCYVVVDEDDLGVGILCVF